MDSTRPPNARRPVQVNNDDGAPSSKTVNLLTGIIALRVWNAFGIQTFFQPDECYQSLEPAWSLAFGDDSGAWLTWEWRERLRSSIHPVLFAGLYKGMDFILERFKYDSRERAMLLITAPKFLQGIFAGVMEIFSYRLASKVFGDDSQNAFAVLLLTLLSPWQWFASTRTLSNCLEAMLTVIALDLWPWEWFLAPDDPVGASKKNDDLRNQAQRKTTSMPPIMYAALLPAALGCILRPTNIIIWALISCGMLTAGANKAKIIPLIKAATVSGSAVLALSLVVDRWFYGEWVFPPWEFLHFNIVQSLAGFYGTNRIHYYFTEAFLLLMTAAAPFAVAGIIQTWNTDVKDSKSSIPLLERRIRKVLNFTVCLSILAFSLIAHKEVRFIYPLLPMLHILAARPLVSFCAPIWKGQKKWRGVLLGLGLVLNLGIAYYASYIHQRGVIDVMHYLRHERELHYIDTKSNMTVGFLMPCHSTPWRSHFVYPNIEAWALTCEPPLGLTQEQRSLYLDEADVFYVDPERWMDRNLDKNGDDGKRKWPDYVVFFEQLEGTIKKVLDGSEYGECWRTFNTHWHDDWRRQGDVVVWCARTSASR